VRKSTNRRRAVPAADPDGVPSAAAALGAPGWQRPMPFSRLIPSSGARPGGGSPPQSAGTTAEEGDYGQVTNALNPAMPSDANRRVRSSV